MCKLIAQANHQFHDFESNKTYQERKLTFIPEGLSMKLSLYVFVRKLWNEQPWPGN